MCMGVLMRLNRALPPTFSIKHIIRQRLRLILIKTHGYILASILTKSSARFFTIGTRNTPFVYISPLNAAFVWWLLRIDRCTPEFLRFCGKYTDPSNRTLHMALYRKFITDSMLFSFEDVNNSTVNHRSYVK
jgi:hypothetical protein